MDNDAAAAEHGAPGSASPSSASTPRCHRKIVSEEEFADLRDDEAAAEEVGMKWQQRGSPPETTQPRLV